MTIEQAMFIYDLLKNHPDQKTSYYMSHITDKYSILTRSIINAFILRLGYKSNRKGYTILDVTPAPLNSMQMYFQRYEPLNVAEEAQATDISASSSNAHTAMIQSSESRTNQHAGAFSILPSTEKSRLEFESSRPARALKRSSSIVLNPSSTSTSTSTSTSISTVPSMQKRMKRSESIVLPEVIKQKMKQMGLVLNQDVMIATDSMEDEACIQNTSIFGFVFNPTFEDGNLTIEKLEANAMSDVIERRTAFMKICSENGMTEDEIKYLFT